MYDGKSTSDFYYIISTAVNGEGKVYQFSNSIFVKESDQINQKDPYFFFLCVLFFHSHIFSDINNEGAESADTTVESLLSAKSFQT